MKTILEVVRDLIKPYIDTNASNIATVEDSTVENPYYVGDQLIYKGVLYNVTADISIGDTLEIGTNISVAPKLSNSIKSALNKLKSDGTSSGTDFNFDIQNGVPGWNSASNRDSSTFHPFSPGSTASDISYDNTTSGLTATDVQAAIDEVDSEKLPTYANDASSWDTTPTTNSTKPVTSGGVKTQLDSINSNKASQSVIATMQANLTAVKAYVIGEQFIYNNTLYEATAAIAKNATITIGGNATTADNISSQISNLANLIPQNYGIEDIPFQNGGSMDANLAFKRVRIYNANSGALPAFATSGNNDMIVINHWYAANDESLAIQIAYNLRADNIAFRRFLNGWQLWHTII